MAKIFWHADGGCHTGFARVTHSVGERLVRDYGHEIHVLATNFLGDDFESTLEPGKKTPLWLYRPTARKGDDMYGWTRIFELMTKIDPDVCVLYNDPAILLGELYDNQYDPYNILLQARPNLTYIPCDGTNLPPEWAKLTKITNVVAMSKYGQGWYPGSKLIYHGVDTDQFWPVKERPIVTSTGVKVTTKKEAKDAFGFPKDSFLILRIDKNSGRKDFPATFKALAPVMRKHSDIRVHFHTERNGGLSGVDIDRLISREPDLARERFTTPDFHHDSWIGWPQEDLNALINAADLVVSTSRGEGFGLTLAEALACGVPVIAQNVSAIPEVVGPGGVLIEPQRLITVPSGEDLWLADIEAFTDAIEHLYESAGARRSLGEAGVQHVRENFRWDVAAERFDKYLTALATDGTAYREETNNDDEEDQHDS